MVQTNNIYDNIIARVHDGDTDKEIILLKHPSKSDGIRARVGVIDMVGHMNSVTKILENMEKAAEPAGVSQATESKSMATYFDTFVQNIFKLKVSDHLPVRMQLQIELPTSMTDEREEVKMPLGVGGLNLSLAPGSHVYRLVNSGSRPCTRKQNRVSSAVHKSNKGEGEGSCHYCRKKLTEHEKYVTVRPNLSNPPVTLSCAPRIPSRLSSNPSTLPLFGTQCTKKDCDISFGGGLKGGNCLNNRHGEDIDKAIESNTWVCPKCRGSCGDGCKTCCTCSFCRKDKYLEPLGRVLEEAKLSGFDNVHDYAVHRETKETQEQLRKRKTAIDWGKWLLSDFVPPKPMDSDDKDEVLPVPSPVCQPIDLEMT